LGLVTRDPYKSNILAWCDVLGVLVDVAAPQRGDQVKQVFYKKKTWPRQQQTNYSKLSKFVYFYQMDVLNI
jgi:hypothetical protein